MMERDVGLGVAFAALWRERTLGNRIGKEQFENSELLHSGPLELNSW